LLSQNYNFKTHYYSNLVKNLGKDNKKNRINTHISQKTTKTQPIKKQRNNFKTLDFF
jgi:hypothetical protein